MFVGERSELGQQLLHLRAVSLFADEVLVPELLEAPVELHSIHDRHPNVAQHEGVIGADERVVCILTGHQLKDPTATVAYHTTDQQKFNEVLGSRGVKRAAFANRAVAVSNELNEIVKAIQLYS